MKKNDLKKTTEYQYYKSNFIILFILYILLVSLFFFTITSLEDTRGIEYAITGLITLIFAPMLIYYAYRIKEVLKSAETYKAYQIHFIELSQSFFSLLAFDLMIPITDFKKIKVTTKAIYSSSMFSLFMPRIVDYHNKENTVFYSETLNKVLVLKKGITI